MSSETATSAPSLLRRALPWLGVLILVAGAYDGFIFYSRWSADRDAAAAQASAEAERARQTLRILGGDALKINNFYAVPAIIRGGQDARICYGVTGAKTLRMDPPVDNVYPSMTHCVEVSPRTDTEYTLIAEDAAGHTASESFILRVSR